jgi:hydrogenase expression/formation protein HypD
MRFVDEFRDADKARALSAKITALCEPGRQYKLMEVCGGHTHTIYKHGLEDYLPESITLVHGPGCPVCVIPMGRVDDAMHLASADDVIMTSFGDMMRVPGSRGSFFDAKAAGTDIRMVYSPLDSLKIHGHRVRDHRSVDRDDGAAGRVRGTRELLGLLQPCHDRPGHQGDTRLARPEA